MSADHLPPSLRQACSWLLGTQSRQRMAAVAGTAVLFSFFTVGIDVIFPIWVTRDLGYTAQDWATLRSLRMVGILGGVVLLGALSDRFGQRLIGACSIIGVALMLVVLGLGVQGGLWIIMPAIGALASTGFINLNSLTQQVSDRRQGLANSIYRGLNSASGVVAPILVTSLALWWDGYPPVFLAGAVFAVLAAAVLMLYPGEPVPGPMSSLGGEMSRLWGSYMLALRERELMKFIIIAQIWVAMLSGGFAFAAIRLTAELELSDQMFGALTSVAGVLAVLSALASALVLDRVPLKRTMAVFALLGSGGCILMGLSDWRLLTMVGYVMFAIATSVGMGPLSMWVSRCAGKASQASAFTVHKLITALFMAIAMAGAGLMERWLSLRVIMLISGLAALVFSVWLAALPEPPPARRHPVREDPPVTQEEVREAETADV